jgi:MoxR-like ATPase
MTQLSVNPAQAQVLVQDLMDAGLVPLLKGSPGTSKSSIMHRIAKERNLKLIDIRLAQIDEVELN